MFSGLEGALSVRQSRCDSNDATELCFSVESTIPLQNIQLIQPLHLGLDAASYVIAPGAMYDLSMISASSARAAGALGPRWLPPAWVFPSC